MPSIRGKTRPLATAAVVVVAGAALVVRPGLGGPDPAPPVPPASSELQAEARRVFEAFNGTPVQNDAAGVVHAWNLNGAMDTCLAERGFPEWDWSQARHHNGALDPLGTSVFFAEPHGTPVADSVMATAPREASEVGRGAEPTGSAAAAVDMCSRPSRASVRDGRAPSQPPAARRLRFAWWELMRRLDTRFGDADVYRQCMEDADLGAVDGADLAPGELGMALLELQPDADDVPSSPSAPEADDKAWTDFVATEQQVAAADWRCRADTYETHLGDARAAIAAFEATHAAAIARARRGWRHVEERAADLGFDAQTGELTERS